VESDPWTLVLIAALLFYRLLQSIFSLSQTMHINVTGL
jgi:hypothetical protein